MRRRLVLCLMMLVALFLTATAGESEKWSQSEYLPGRLIVEFSPSVKIRESSVDDAVVVTGNAALDALFSEVIVRSVRRWVPDQTLARLRVPPDLYNVYVVEYAGGQQVLDAIDLFAANGEVLHVQPDLLCRVKRAPNDPYWNYQWDKRIVGADTVWNVSTGSRDIICAGIDTGVDWAHPDLTPNLWVNPGEDLNHDSVAWNTTGYPGDVNDVDGADNDDNGYVDDLLGWDFIHGVTGCATGEDCDGNMDNNMLGTNPHGTHVAGLMVARGNNGIGVAGMSWIGRLMALRAGYNAADQNGYIPESASGPAILYAAANGAKIINMSYGGTDSDTYSQQVINAAWDQGCLLFAASGNEGSTTPEYPANYDNVIAVNATDSNDQLAWWSNRGSWTDLCAPGSGEAQPGIMSTVIGGYGMMEGTSMASPNAAGVAALVWSVFPNMANAQLRDLLFSSAQDIHTQNPGVPPSYLGHGRIDAKNAVATLYPQMRVTGFVLSDTLGGDGDGRLETGETGRLFLTCTNVVGWANGSSITAVVSSTDPNLTIGNASWYLGEVAAGQSVNNAASPATITVSASLDTAYWQNIHVTFSSPNGYAETHDVQLRIGRGRVLIVDDDGGANFEHYYVDAVSHAGASSDLWSASDGVLASAEMSSYPVLLWSCGDAQTSTLTPGDQVHLATYLNAGGNLILIGQNIDEDLRSSPFYGDYLHAQTDTGSGERELTGVVGNPISDGMTLMLQGGDCAGNGVLSPSRILPMGGAASVFTYNQGGIGAVMYAGDYRVAYYAFALEAACGLGGTNHLNDVIASTLNWMNVLSVSPTTKPALPSSVALRGNYPNPFNPSTTILFDLASPSQVRLQVFDILGRSVATLLNQPLTAGSHSAVFDGSGFASGVYLIRLEAGTVTLSSKMVLMK
jgi:subtilisin family serine protease